MPFYFLRKSVIIAIMNIETPTLVFKLLKHRFWRIAVILVAGLILAGGSQLALSSPAFAAQEDSNNNSIVQGICSGVNLSFDEQENCDSEEADEKVSSTLATILNLFSIIAGIATVIMVIYAGFRYIVSGGDEKGVKSAKNTMLYAIVGIVLVLLAQVIVQFVFGRLTE